MSEPLTMEVEEREGYILARLMGRYDLRPASTLMTELARRCKRERKRKLILDALGVEGNPNVHDRHELIRLMAEDLPRPCYIAVVRPKEIGPIDPFSELTASNRGLSLKVFTEWDEAERWMGEAGA
jgi:hypothetical protein